MRALAVVLAIGVATPAVAQPFSVPERDRTVSWYVAHPYDLARVTRACRNDPGHGIGRPDCINADEARLEQSFRRDRAALNDDARTPGYWRARPQQRVMQAARCAALPEQYRASNFCDVVAGR